MSIMTKELYEEIQGDVEDVVKTSFIHNSTKIVPNLADEGLTYERGQEKKGKVINTCVLYVDIRNSVTLTKKHNNTTMGRVYTAFTKAVLKTARYHNGHTRNIIGDRVMIVFPNENCFTNAVDCAISINHIVKNIINKKFPDVDFKCGIGVDYGELRVIKVGIQRRGEEHGENKGLVWVGYPANHASRLTDNANKEIRETVFKVKQYPIIPDFSFLFPAIPPFYTKMSEIGSSKPIIKYSTKEETTVLSAEEFAKKVYITRDGKFDIYGGRFVSFSKVENIYNYPGILMTEAVYKGYSEANPTSYDVIHNLWKEQNHNIKNISGKIYGSDIEWILK